MRAVDLLGCVSKQNLRHKTMPPFVAPIHPDYKLFRDPSPRLEFISSAEFRHCHAQRTSNESLEQRGDFHRVGYLIPGSNESDVTSSPQILDATLQHNQMQEPTSLGR
jgi:hypothetical protein